MKTTTLATLCLVAAGLLWSSTVRAEEADADTRFHDAYVLEVIEGKVADAAKVYLVLMRDEKVSKRLRAESRFRFAICTVLLGRPDEARAHLTALIDDADTPKAVRTRAETYRTSISDMELGTELDKKLQALLFDLGRADPGGMPVTRDAYRDFEIIGKPAVPFLKKLLQHSDVNLRRHAYRLLCRMDEPGMGAAWAPDLLIFTHGFRNDFLAYLQEHEPEREALEARVLALGKPGLERIRSLSTGPALFSHDFLRRFAESKIAPKAAVAWLGTSIDDGAFDLLVTWLDGPDAALGDAALDWLLRYGRGHARADEAFYRKAMERLLERLGEPKTPISGGAIEGFRLLGARMPAGAILAVIERLMDEIERDVEQPDVFHPDVTLIRSVASGFDQVEKTPAEAKAYAALLLRWIAANDKGNEILRKRGKSGEFLPVRDLARHLRNALMRMDDERAEETIRRIFSEPGRAEHLHWIVALPRLADARSVRLWAMAVAAAPAGSRKSLLTRMQPQSMPKPNAEALTALNAAHRGLLEVLTPAEARLAFAGYGHIFDGQSAEAAQRDFLAVLELARSLGDEKRRAVRDSLFAASPEFFNEVLAPLAAAQWERFDTDERRRLLKSAFSYLNWNIPDVATRDRARAAAASVIRPHVAEVEPRSLLLGLGRHPKRYPIEAWLPLVPEGLIRWHAPPFPTEDYEESDIVARRMLEDPANVNGTVLGYVRRRCSAEAQREIFDRLLRSDDGEHRVLALLLLDPDGQPASPGALEAYLTKELASQPPDLSRLRRAGRKLLALRPSEALFPVARLLLRSTEPREILAGISMADSLGRADLVPDLRPHLKSMNASVRVAARKALAAIRAIAEIQADVPGRGR